MTGATETMAAFAAGPFHLDADARRWVADSLATLTDDQMLRQLFHLRIAGDDPAVRASVAAFGPGGITRHVGGDLAGERALMAALNAGAATPLLVSADLEGSRMSLPFGLEYPNPLALAAADDTDRTEAIARLMAREARSAGINWSFTPVLDINAAFRSPIVATRGFGSDPDRIRAHALATIRGFQAEGVAATAKHWPGEGHDDRDQHLVTTINPLSADAWEATHGALYRAAIAAGVMAVMSAHIALPEYVRAQGGTDPRADPGVDPGVEAYRPASISALLTTQLLRRDLGFAGLIVSDATAMAGLGSWGPRARTLPEVVMAGCDAILFSDAPALDLGYLQAALADGRLTMARVTDAVRRQLALKAALGLHRPGPLPDFVPDASDLALVDRATRAAPTLVKDVQHLLPIRVARHRRIRVMTPGIVFPFTEAPLPFILPDLLTAEGFEVTLHDRDAPAIGPDTCDLLIYLFGDETLLTRGRIFLDWLRLTGNFGAAMRRHWHEVPTMMISFGYPYMLYDAPRMPCVINAYATTDTMQRAVTDLILGRGNWQGKSPVDPFCGLGDARY